MLREVESIEEGMLGCRLGNYQPKESQGKQIEKEREYREASLAVSSLNIVIGHNLA